MMKRGCERETTRRVVWFTGLPCSGKTTLARALDKCLHQKDLRTCVLDGDNLRHGLCANLGFNKTDRDENIRRVAEAAKLLMESGSIVIVAVIAPLEAHRVQVRKIIGESNVIEVFCHCPVEVCERRDVKGMYKKARNGQIEEFTGVSSPYEDPISPDVIVDTANKGIAYCLAEIEAALLLNRTPRKTL